MLVNDIQAHPDEASASSNKYHLAQIFPSMFVPNFQQSTNQLETTMAGNRIKAMAANEMKSNTPHPSASTAHDEHPKKRRKVEFVGQEGVSGGRDIEMSGMTSTETTVAVDDTQEIAKQQSKCAKMLRPKLN